MENGVVTVLYFFAERRGRPLKSFHDFWDTLMNLHRSVIFYIINVSETVTRHHQC